VRNHDNNSLMAQISPERSAELHTTKRGMSPDIGVVETLMMTNPGPYSNINIFVDETTANYACGRPSDNVRVMIGSQVRLLRKEKACTPYKHYDHGMYTVMKNMGTVFELKKQEQEQNSAPVIPGVLNTTGIKAKAKAKTTPAPTPIPMRGTVPPSQIPVVPAASCSFTSTVARTRTYPTSSSSSSSSSSSLPPPHKKQRCFNAATGSITTAVDGVTYRSRLEARTAVFMKSAGVRFVYEKCTFQDVVNVGQTYTIDLFLPAQQLWVEIKPQYPTLGEIAKCEDMARSGFRVALLYGDTFLHPFAPPNANLVGNGGERGNDGARLNGMMWDLEGNRLPGDVVWKEDPGTKIIELVRASSTAEIRAALPTPRLLDLLKAAKDERFLWCE
jgi:hypothetical protein